MTRQNAGYSGSENHFPKYETFLFNSFPFLLHVLRKIFFYRVGFGFCISQVQQIQNTSMKSVLMRQKADNICP